MLNLPLRVVFLCSLLGRPGSPALATECGGPCQGDIPCALEAAACHLEEAGPREAIELLKPLLSDHPGDTALATALARAYLADGNSFWALRTLMTALDAAPGDCALRSWIAWVHISEGDFDLARDRLGEPGCPRTPPEQSRWQLLEGFMASSEGDTQAAKRALDEVAEAGAIFGADEALWSYLDEIHDPGRRAPLEWAVELGAGYTSNARAGSPVDPDLEGTPSGIGRADVFLRFEPPIPWVVRPAIDGGLKLHGITAADARQLSYMELSLRPGLIIGRDRATLFIGYKPDLLLLAQDEKRVFYEGHRAEVQLEVGRVTLFTGGGRRIFAEGGRTRLELDGGLGTWFTLGGRARFLLALSGRAHDARGESYDLVGGSALAVVNVALGAGIDLRMGAIFGLDSYLNSKGERGILAHGIDSARHDRTMKLTGGLWSPSWSGLRLGLEYEFSMRSSNAQSENQDYSYLDNRLMATLKWRKSFDPRTPALKKNPAPLPLDYGVGPSKKEGLDDERIQDLLRQDEAARGGSSCVE